MSYNNLISFANETDFQGTKLSVDDNEISSFMSMINVMLTA